MPKINPDTPVTPLKLWMRAATVEEQEQLAKELGTSRGTLYQYGNQHRGASVERAIAIEVLTTHMHNESKGRLPIVYRTDLTAVCRGCAFARKCLGDAIIVRGEFEPAKSKP